MFPSELLVFNLFLLTTYTGKPHKTQFFIYINVWGVRADRMVYSLPHVACSSCPDISPRWGRPAERCLFEWSRSCYRWTLRCSRSWVVCRDLAVDVEVKVEVTLRLTVSQSVLVSSPKLGHLTRIFLFPSKLLFCLFGAPSLTKGRVCHVSVFVIEVYHSLDYLQQYLHLN
jgi:hypothetical protein